MGSILQPGFVYWDGFKYTLQPGTGGIGPQGPAGPAGANGANGASGASGNAVLVFQPGGTASGNVYTTWASLWAARTQDAQTTETPMTIVIDDSHQSPALIETSGVTYHLNKNTPIVGYRNATDTTDPNNNTPGAPVSPHTTMPFLSIPDTVIFTDPCYFQNLIVYGVDNLNVGVFQASTFTTMDFLAIDVQFAQVNGTMFKTPGGTVDLAGNTEVNGNTNGYQFTLAGNNATYTFNLYDTTQFDPELNGAIRTTELEGDGYLIVNTLSQTAQWYDGNIVGHNTFNGGWLTSNWNQATAGQVLTMVDSGGGGNPRATWQTPSSGGSPSSILVYKPGGVATGNIYTNWATLMTARNAVSGPATIYIDDTITSPAVIPSGGYNLNGNTNIIGIKGPSAVTHGGSAPFASGMTQLSLASGAILFDPRTFRDLEIQAVGQSIQATGTGTHITVNVDCYDVVFEAPSASTPIFSTYVQSGTKNSVVNLYGSSYVASVGASHPVFFDLNFSTANTIFNLYDQSYIDNNTLQYISTGRTLDININTGAAVFNTTQTNTTNAVSVTGVSVTGSPTTGQLLTATSASAATWQTAAAGGGYNTIATVGATGEVGSALTSRTEVILLGTAAAADTGSATTFYAGSYDGGAARRNYASRWYRRDASTQALTTYVTLNNQGWISQSPFTGVNATGISTGGSGQSCGAITTIGDYLYFSGQQPQIDSEDPRLFGINTRTGQTLVPITGSTGAQAGYIYQYTNTFTLDWIWDLIGIRMNVAAAPFNGGPADLLFSVSKGFVALGYMTGGGATYNSIYQTTLASSGSATNGAFACCIGSGNSHDGPNVGQSVTGNATLPSFAFIGANGYLYIVDGSGTVHLADNSSPAYQAIYYDDDGILWSSHLNGSATMLKRWRISFSTNTVIPYTIFDSVSSGSFTALNSISYGTFLPLPLGLCSDGKLIWGLSGQQGIENLNTTFVTAYDRATMERVVNMQLIPPTGYTDYGSQFGRIVFDGEAIWVGSTGYNAGLNEVLPILYKINPINGEILYTSGIVTPPLVAGGISNYKALNMTVSDTGQIYYTTCDAADRYGGLAIITASGSEAGAHLRNLYLDQLPIGPGGIQTGSLTLGGGTGAATVNTGITINSLTTTKVFVQLVTPGGTLGSNYKVTVNTVGGPGVPTPNGSFTVQAINSSGSNVTTDTSTLSYMIVG